MMTDTNDCTSSMENREQSPPKEEVVKCPEIGTESFDPYDYGQPDGITHLGATAHLIRSSVGSGILVMPYAMKNLGFVTGSVLMVAVSLVYFHTVSTLLSTEYRLCKRLRVKRFTFIGLTDKLFEMAPFPLCKARRSMRYLMYVYYGLPVGGAAWMIVMSGSIRNVAKYFHADLQTTHIVSGLTVPLAACCMFDGLLRILVPFSALTNCMSLAMAAIVAACAILHGSAEPRPRPFGAVAFVPQGLALFVEALRCTAAVIPLKNDMRKPRKMAGATGAVSITAVALTLLYTGFGVVCYAFYGDQVADNVLANLPANDLVLLVVNLLYTFEMLVAYVLTFYVYFLNVWSAELQDSLADSRYKCIVEYAIRLAIIVFGYLMAVGVPNLALISSMAGTAGIVVELALPSMLQLLLELTQKRKGCWLICKNLCILSFSAALFGLSVVSCVREVIHLYCS